MLENETVDQTDNSQSQDSSPGSSNNNFSQESSNNQSVQEAIAELEKMERFKFQGQEWTPKDLEKAIMRNKDYTQKTQTLSEERKSLEQERKYAENLYWDLQNVVKNPQLASEFLRIYPEKYHSLLKDALGVNTQNASTAQESKQAPQYDVETLSRLQRLENVLFEQEVAKNEAAINSHIDSLTKKYPDAIPKLAIAEVYDAHTRGEKITNESWEKAFKAADEEMKAHLKSKYGELVKQQTTANKKSKDVPAGGGIAGRAPQKFKNIAEVTKYAISQAEAQKG